MQRLFKLPYRCLVRSPAVLSTCSKTTAHVGLATKPIHLDLKQQRFISISSLYCKQQGSSSSDKQRDQGKKSMMDVANETLENAGLKSRSKRYSRGSGDKTTMENHHDGHDKSSTSSQKSTGSLKDKRSTGSGQADVNLGSQARSPGMSGDKKRGGRLGCDHHYHANKPVRLDKRSKRFVLDLGNNQMARIDYKDCGDGCIDLYHTEVPREMQGKGIGSALARGAFEMASKNNLKLKLSCDFLQDYLKRFPDYKGLVKS